MKVYLEYKLRKFQFEMCLLLISVTMSAFFRHYPEFKKYPFPAELTFSWYWYYAMQQNGDDQAAPGVRAMAEKLALRQKITSLASLLLPGIQAQLTLNGIAGSDLESHLEFQRAIRKYHERMWLSSNELSIQNC